MDYEAEYIPKKYPIKGNYVKLIPQRLEHDPNNDYENSTSVVSDLVSEISYKFYNGYSIVENFHTDLSDDEIDFNDPDIDAKLLHWDEWGDLIFRVKIPFPECFNIKYKYMLSYQSYQDVIDVLTPDEYKNKYGEYII